jgi:hypothetical protein
MALALYVKKNGDQVFACNGTLQSGGILQPLHDFRNIALRRYGKLWILITGNLPYIEDALLSVDFAALGSNKLSLAYLYQNFYLPYVARLTQDKTLDVNDDGTLTNYPVKILFCDGDQTFVFDEDGLSNPGSVAFLGSATEYASTNYIILEDLPNAESIALGLMKSAVRNTTQINYPIYLAHYGRDEVTVLEQNGSSHQEILPDLSKEE